MYDHHSIGTMQAPVRLRTPLVSREPTLEEMLADPIIRDRITADGLHVSTVKQVVIDAIERHRG